MAAQAEVRYLNDEWRDRSDVPEIGARASRRADGSARLLARVTQHVRPTWKTRP